MEQTSRLALADVREAITGYRGQGFAAELIQARRTLETAGITVDCDASEVPLSPAQESVLALALREAVTNVVRHAQAQRCSVRLSRDQELCILEIADNGRGADAPEGNGLRGMRERLEAIGGSLQRQTAKPEPASLFICLSPQPPLLCETERRAARQARQNPGRPRRRPGHGPGRARRAARNGRRHRGGRARWPNGYDALRAVQEARPDVFITDIEMPTLTGLEVAAELKRRGVPVRVIILTTFARAGYLRRALDAGASGYLLKDMPAEQLAEAVRRVHHGLRVIDPQLAAEAWTDEARSAHRARAPGAAPRRRRHGQLRHRDRTEPVRRNGTKLSLGGNQQTRCLQPHRGRADRPGQGMAVSTVMLPSDGKP